MKQGILEISWLFGSKKYWHFRRQGVIGDADCEPDIAGAWVIAATCLFITRAPAVARGLGTDVYSLLGWIPNAVGLQSTWR